MSKIITDSEKIDEILNHGTIVDVLPTKKEFREKLLSGQKLKFYIGFDATAPTLHLSHAKNFMLLEKFRNLGHEIIVLFGDFTARIGDPTGKKSARKQLSREEVLSNVEKWKKLIEPLMDFSAIDNPPKIMYNHDWLSKLTLEDVINLASNFTVQQMLARDMFQERLKDKFECKKCGNIFFQKVDVFGEVCCDKCNVGADDIDPAPGGNRPIYLHEFLYPLMQGYDSVVMEVDVEVCGTDQIFNALAGRTLLKKLKNKDKFVVAVTLMENPKTGELMSKSKGTGVFLDTSPNDMFGQIMAQPDEMIEILFVNNTYLPLKEIKKIMSANNPRETKAKLAREIITIYHGKDEAEKAEEEFNKIFRDKQKPSDIKSYKLQVTSYKLIDLLIELKMASSKSEAKRLIQQGGVKIDVVVQKDWNKIIEIKNGMIAQVGKRKFVKIVL